jgi:hypothetical protein
METNTLTSKSSLGAYFLSALASMATALGVAYLSMLIAAYVNMALTPDTFFTALEISPLVFISGILIGLIVGALMIHFSVKKIAKSEAGWSTVAMAVAIGATPFLLMAANAWLFSFAAVSGAILVSFFLNWQLSKSS